jgi:hypothetical protein
VAIREFPFKSGHGFADCLLDLDGGGGRSCGGEGRRRGPHRC